MSLVRLLTAGKSLVGLKDNGNRYRVTSQRLLPKFNAKDEAARVSATEPRPLGAEIKSETPTPSRAPVPQLRTPTVALPAGSPSRGWFQRICSGPWFKRTGSTRPSVPGFSKAMVQPELLLESVKVVRNDLSDSDLEIVAAKAPSPKAESTPAAPIQTGAQSRWAQMKGRLFAAGKQ